jgi:N-acyl-D-amino-acid deacylase
MERNVLGIVCALGLACNPGWTAETNGTAPAHAEEFFHAIRNNDLKTLRQLAATGNANVRDKLETTPLHYAALYGSAESVKILLDAGAEPNARNNSQTTPLIYAAYDFAKTKMLVEKGADVNAANSTQIRPLYIAVSAHGNAATVRYLIQHGADTKAFNARGTDYLQRAAGNSEPEVVRLLLDQGADPHRANDSGYTALAEAFFCDDGGRVKMLLDAGSDVNAANHNAGKVKNGPIALTEITPLMRAVDTSPASTVSALLAKGANVNAVDVRDMTPLMFAVANERPNLETVRRLIAAGANLNVKDVYGDTALDWARKFAIPEVVSTLQKAGAQGHDAAPPPVRPADYKPAPREAINRSSALLATTAEKFFVEGGGCVGCHHQPLVGRAFAVLKATGAQPDPRLRRVLVDGMTAERPILLSRLPLLISGGGDYDSLLHPMIAMAELGEPASPLTDAIVHYLAARQMPNGAWSLPGGERPPLQDSDISRTMMAIWTLKTYGWPARQAEFDDRIARARAWLLSVQPGYTIEECDLLMALWLTGSSDAELRSHAKTLLSHQRADGGWAQTPHLESDAYGTAFTLYSLWKTGMLKAADTPYQKGVSYLLNTQYPDGSWFVRSRAPKLQPYFQSGFPYNHEQWISASATSYAVMALAPAAH